MKINLQKIPALVINRHEDTERAAHMTALCDTLKLNWQFTEGGHGEPSFQGCNLGHLRAYNHAQAKPPFLILEDDCEITNSYFPMLVIPDDADIVYLGVSMFGVVEPLENHAFIGAVLTSEYNDQLLRIHNMTSTHAVLYVSERALRLAITSIQNCIEKALIPHDVGLANIQNDLNVYAYKAPLFYQFAQLQNENKKGVEFLTKFNLDRIPQSEITKVNFRSESKQLRRVENPKGHWHWQLMTNYLLSRFTQENFLFYLIKITITIQIILKINFSRL